MGGGGGGFSSDVALIGVYSFEKKEQVLEFSPKVQSTLIENVVRTHVVPSFAVRTSIASCLVCFYEKTATAGLVETFMKLQGDLNKRTEAKLYVVCVCVYVYVCVCVCVCLVFMYLCVCACVCARVLSIRNSNALISPT